VFQKCPVRPTNAGTELHHPDSDIAPFTALRCRPAQLHAFVFGNGNACLTVPHQAFAAAPRETGFKDRLPKVSSRNFMSLRIASAILPPMAMPVEGY
jgi:hypothetical protein